MTSVPFTIKPGQPGPWRSVQAMLREQHDEARRATDEAIAKRKERGVPLDDLADWRAAMGDLLDKAEAEKDREAVVEILAKASAIAAGPLRPLGEFVPAPELVRVEVRLRALSKVDVMDMQAALSAIDNGADVSALLRGNIESHRVMREFLRKCLVGVRGAEVDAGTIEVDDLDPAGPVIGDVLGLLDEGGYLPAFFTVARAYQVASPLLRRRSGLSGHPTCPPSDAMPARPPAVPSSGVKAAPLGPTSEESPDSKPTPALDGTSIGFASVPSSTSIAGPASIS